jgi:uncharacterized protein (DUF2252 family)
MLCKHELECDDVCGKKDSIRDSAQRFNDFLDRKAREDDKHILLSDESITRLTAKAGWVSSAIKKAFASYETKVVVNCRRYLTSWSVSTTKTS